MRSNYSVQTARKLLYEMVESGEIGLGEVMNFFFVEQPQTPLEAPPFNDYVKPMYNSTKTFVRKFLRQKGLSLATPTSGRGASGLTMCKSSASTLLRRSKALSLLADRCANNAATVGFKHVSVAVEVSCDVSFSLGVPSGTLSCSPSLFPELSFLQPPSSLPTANQEPWRSLRFVPSRARRDCRTLYLFGAVGPYCLLYSSLHSHAHLSPLVKIPINT